MKRAISFFPYGKPKSRPFTSETRLWALYPGRRVAHAFYENDSICGQCSEDGENRRGRVAFGVHDRHCKACVRKLGFDMAGVSFVSPV